MADITAFVGSDIPNRIYAFHEKKKEDWRRPHLGASVIGKECNRAIWYGFHWAVAPSFGGRMLRLFETGQMAENRIICELQNIGIHVHSMQKRVSAFGHFGGSIDALGEGFLESSAVHVLEFKTHNAKSFAELSKKGVKEAKPQHYDQMTVYMGLLFLERAYYIAINKDTDEIYAERVRLDKSRFNCIMQKAKSIIDAPIPPPRMETSPAAFSCKFCEFAVICHAKGKPEVNCRTCCHSTPAPDGSWICGATGRILDLEIQKSGCEDHLFVPVLLNKEVFDAGGDWVEYADGWKNYHNSREYRP